MRRRRRRRVLRIKGEEEGRRHVSGEAGTLQSRAPGLQSTHAGRSIRTKKTPQREGEGRRHSRPSGA